MHINPAQGTQRGQKNKAIHPTRLNKTNSSRSKTNARTYILSNTLMSYMQYIDYIHAKGGVCAKAQQKREKEKKSFWASYRWDGLPENWSQVKPSPAKPSQANLLCQLFCIVGLSPCAQLHVRCIMYHVSRVLCPVSCVDVSKCRAETVTFSSENKKKQQRATWHAYTQHTRSYTRVSFIFQIGSRPPSCLLESLCSSRDVSSFAS